MIPSLSIEAKRETVPIRFHLHIVGAAIVRGPPIGQRRAGLRQRTVYSNGDLVIMSPNINLHIMKLY